jgi:hypothetical protein
VNIRIDVQVRVPFPSMAAAMASARAVPSHPSLEGVYKQWGVTYSAAMRRRFSQFARGGGNWPPLAVSTVAARYGRLGQKISTSAGARGRGDRFDTWTRRGGGTKAGRTSLARDTGRGGKLVGVNKSFSILQDTGTLFRSLNIGSPGNVNRRVSSGIEFGIGGPAKGQRRVQLTFQHKGKRKRTRGLATGSPSIGQIASYHHFGMGRNPVRRVIDLPDAATLTVMRGQLGRGVTAMLRAQSGKVGPARA